MRKKWIVYRTKPTDADMESITWGFGFTYAETAGEYGPRLSIWVGPTIIVFEQEAYERV